MGNKTNSADFLRELHADMQPEIERLKNHARTLPGYTELIKIWENHFCEKYEHGCSVINDIARVNVLRKRENKTILF